MRDQLGGNPATGDQGVLTLTAKNAAELFDVSARTWARWNSSGRSPGPFKVGGSVLWRVADLRAWAAMGFPERAVFDAEVSAVPCAVYAPEG